MYGLQPMSVLASELTSMPEMPKSQMAARPSRLSSMLLGCAREHCSQLHVRDTRNSKAGKKKHKTRRVDSYSSCYLNIAVYNLLLVEVVERAHHIPGDHSCTYGYHTTQVAFQCKQLVHQRARASGAEQR